MTAGSSCVTLKSRRTVTQQKPRCSEVVRLCGLCSAMLTASECLARATEMDDRAAKTSGHDREEFLRLALGWRYAAQMALWQDKWEMHNVIDGTRH